MRARRLHPGDTVRLQRSAYVTASEFLTTRVGQLGRVVEVLTYTDDAVGGMVEVLGGDVLYQVQLPGLATVPLTARDVSLVARAATLRQAAQS